MRHFIFLVLLLSIVSVVGWRLWQTSGSDARAAAKGKAPVAIEYSQAFQGDIEDIVGFDGSLSGKAEVLVSSKISGRVNAIHVDLGDEVTENQPIAELDEVELRHAVEEADARLHLARATLEELEVNLSNAESEMQRIQTLRDRKVASAADMEAGEANYFSLLARKKVADAGIRQQDAVLQAEKVRLSYARILAPITGVVGKRFLDEGTMVSSTTPIVSLADISSIKITISVVERDYAKMRLGLQATLTVDAYPGQVFSGAVSRIAPVLDPDTRSAEVEIVASNDAKLLKPGMFTNVRICFGVHEDVTLIPSRALVKRDQREGVFVPTGDLTIARFIVVKTGLANTENVEVNGIEPGQAIVTMGQHLLTDGDAIVVNEPNESPSAGIASE